MISTSLKDPHAAKMIMIKIDEAQHWRIYKKAKW